MAPVRLAEVRSVNDWAIAGHYYPHRTGRRDMSTAGIINRNKPSIPTGARAAATLTGGSGSFTATMAGRYHGALPAVPAGKASAATTTSMRTQSGDSAGDAAYRKYVGRSTGSGQCVALVCASNPAIGSTAQWVRGDPVQGQCQLAARYPHRNLRPFGALHKRIGWQQPRRDLSRTDLTGRTGARPVGRQPRRGADNTMEHAWRRCCQHRQRVPRRQVSPDGECIMLASSTAIAWAARSHGG